MAADVIRTKTYAGTGRLALVLFVAVALAVTGISLFIGLGTASGMGEGDDSMLGIGAHRAAAVADTRSFDAATELGVAQAPEGSAGALAQATQRPVTSAAAQPVVELAAVDLGDPATIKAAARIGVLNPVQAADRLPLNTSGEGWLVGQASGYDVASSSTLTRSGRAFDDDCVTVAVPEGMEDLLGHPVIIVYDNMVVVATVTDTGGFAKYGRALDLGGGVFKAFGYDDIWEWGVREVHYKFL